jgi:hypothetical protein
MAVRAVMVWVKKGLGIDHLKLISVGPGLGLRPVAARMHCILWLLLAKARQK